ncbi:hypothetical protein SLEP1_g24147 [Rubroshorea leprosula]|uniref:Uncharacterized protein n=1 Tax=Rubroshorea leprosula TaxID=152421 RepID=A0AAV5JQP7_9ROSI|nr:hypothetical protein SLEP1_g24147 [Rubroshorea leprosula]
MFDLINCGGKENQCLRVSDTASAFIPVIEKVLYISISSSFK